MAQPEPRPPGPHPEPPADLDQRPLPLLHTTQAWLRVHRLEYEPLFFGRTGRYRFDAPAGEYGVLYAAGDAHCAFIETLGHNLDVRIIDLRDLRARGLTLLEVSRPLRLVDLTGPGLARLGADGRLTTGDYTVAQRWALALWRHPDRPDGLVYRSRLDPSRLGAAIYDRTADALTAVRLGGPADPTHARLLAVLLETYGFGVTDEPA